jgi:hypothetical protein
LNLIFHVLTRAAQALGFFIAQKSLILTASFFQTMRLFLQKQAVLSSKLIRGFDLPNGRILFRAYFSNKGPFY